ncbi:peptidyl-tRNA hydrolase ICT1, mitochondrial [Impatiens glandulifera]|uniref:peptidyl-tRNA hydrolase ICT1, mitochondrial n=1 Tax=Impatiens glandulifera TaxID=253017 RepID=UPI001FB0F611|nr:peptidyl-tRNA hydrolase ICT1, mitochondrial [Impatiens glandulifera]
MAASAFRATATATMVAKEIFRPSLGLLLRMSLHKRIPNSLFISSCRRISYSPIRCAASSEGEEGAAGKKSSSRLSQIQHLIMEAELRAASASGEPAPPKITLDHVTVNFARSGGPGGQNVNKVNTKVDMRFNVKNAYWLSERIRDKIIQSEKNRINKDGELVVSSTKTRTQKGNIEDALEKLQAIIDAASYVPPPPSQEQIQKIGKLAAAGERKRLDNKKAQSQKKAFRRGRDSWD